MNERTPDKLTQVVIAYRGMSCPSRHPWPAVTLVTDVQNLDRYLRSYAGIDSQPVLRAARAVDPTITTPLELDGGFDRKAACSLEKVPAIWKAAVDEFERQVVGAVAAAAEKVAA